MNRRKLLQAAGGATALGAITGSATADARQQTHEICINAPGDRLYPYQFAVTGRIEKSDSVAHAPYSDDVVTSDAEDDIDGTGCRVHGFVQGGVDCYEFTGDIVAFTVPEQWEGNYAIHTNGYERAARELQTQQDPSDVSCGNSDESDVQDQQGGGETFCELKNYLRVWILGESDGPAEFDIAVNGELELPSGQRVGRHRVRLGEDGGYEEVAFPYSGEITCLKITGPGQADIQQQFMCE